MLSLHGCLTRGASRSSAPRLLRSRTFTTPHHALGPTNAPRSNPRPVPTCPSHPSPAPLDIQLVTQVSLDRWPRFAQQALAWGGPVCVAVYLPCPPDHPLAPAYRHHLQNLVERFHADAAAAAAADSFPTTVGPVNETPENAVSAVMGRRNTTNCSAAAAMPAELSTIATTTQPQTSHELLTVTVVHATHMAREGADVLLPSNVTTSSPPVPRPLPHPPSPQPSYDELYPINALRNAALAAATASHVFLVDGDFIPSSGLRRALLWRPSGQLHAQQQTEQQLPLNSELRTGTLRTSSVVGCCGDIGRAGDVASEGAELEPARGTGSSGKCTDIRREDTRSECGEWVVSGPSEGCSLLELSDRRTRPVMWVVTAFEMLLRQDTSDTATGTTPHSADTGGGGGAGSPYGGGLDSDLLSRVKPPPGVVASAPAPRDPALTDSAAPGRSQCGQLLPELEQQKETAAAAVVPRRLEELVSYRLVDVSRRSARHGGRGQEDAGDVSGDSVSGGRAGGGGGGSGGSGEHEWEEQPRGAAQAEAANVGQAVLRPFHCGRYPQRVPSIDFVQWWAVAVSAVASADCIWAAPTDPWVASTECGERQSQWPLDDGAVVAARSKPPLERPQMLRLTTETEESDMEWREVPYHEYFEPYGIVRRDQVPPYDERFRGYGLNKVQHAYHLAAAGFEFRLLSRHFCVTLPHARSASYTAVFGSAADPVQRQRVEALYDTFKQELYDKYGYRCAQP